MASIFFVGLKCTKCKKPIVETNMRTVDVSTNSIDSIPVVMLDIFCNKQFVCSNCGTVHDITNNTANMLIKNEIKEVEAEDGNTE